MNTLTRCGLAAALLLTSSTALAGGFTPWGTGTGDNTVALSPYVFVAPDGGTTIAPYVFFGKTDHFDAMVGYSMSISPRGPNPVASGAIEFMPRAVFNDNAILALHALYTPGEDSAVLGLEFHGVTGTEHFAFTYNTGWWPTVGGENGGGVGDWFAILAPEFIVTDRLSLFTEFNPAVAIADGTFSATVVPGITFYTDEELNHSFTVAATLNVAPTFEGATFGILYWTAFDLSKRKAVPVSSGVAESMRFQ